MVQDTRIVNGKEQVKQMRKTCEHQVYTVEPSGQYLCHSEIQEDKGTGRGLSEDFYEMLIEHDSVETLEHWLENWSACHTRKTPKYKKKAIMVSLHAAWE